MSWTLLQHTVVPIGRALSPLTASFGSPVTAGSLIVVGFPDSQDADLTITDSGGNTYNRFTTEDLGAWHNRLLYSLPIVTGGSLVLTLTSAGTYLQSSVFLAEFHCDSGNFALTGTPVSNSAGGVSTLSAGAITVAVGDLVVCNGINTTSGQTWTAGDGFTLADQSSYYDYVPSGFLEYMLSAPSTSINPSITMSSTDIIGMHAAAFHEVPGDATGYTITGNSGGHQNSPATWTVTLTGGDFTGTITATPGGGVSQAQIFSPSIVTFTGDGTLSKTFSFTPLIPDTVTYTFTNSGSLTNPATKSYVSTGIYYKDTFSGSSGTDISTITSNTLPSGLVGSGYTVTGSGAIELDGNGLTFLSSSGDTYAISEAVMPTWTRSLNFEILFDFENLSTVPGSVGGVMIQTYSGGLFQVAFYPSDGIIKLLDAAGVYSTTLPAPGTLWHMKLDWIGNTGNGNYPISYLWYSTDGVTWNQLWSGGPYLADGISPVVAVGPYMQGTAVTATTGVHIGNIVLQDVAPPPPNCSIATSSPFGAAGAYVSTSGQKVVFFFATGLSGGTSNITPTSINFAPSLSVNGTFVGVGTNAWASGQHSCVSVDFPSGVSVSSTDVVTVSAPDSWVGLGVGNACSGVVGFSVANYTGKSCFGVDGLTKTFKPGFNFSALGTTAGTEYNIPKNWRYRLEPSEAGSNNTVDGYPTTMFHPTETLSFLNLGTGNGLDSTEFPGVPGMWAIGFDDNYVASSGTPTTLSIVSLDTAKCTSTQVTSVDNVGSGGLNQFYMFNVQRTSGSPSANTPLGLQIVNSAQTPLISNLWIVGPGDFTYTTGVPLTFDRSDTYALSGQFMERLANGVGSMRFADSWITFGSESNESEPWELRNLTDFSWNNGLRVHYNVGYSSLRPVDLAVSPYAYSEFIGSAYNLTLNTGVNSSATSFSINATDSPPIPGLMLTMGTGEKCKVISVSGTSNPYTCVVERGSSNTTAATQSSGTITCTGRLALTSLSQIGYANNGQLLEVVCSGNHNYKTGMGIGFYGSYPDMAFTGGSTNNLTGSGWPVIVTGLTTFVVDMRSAPGGGPLTLSTSYTLDPGTNYFPWGQPDAGFPIDFCAKLVSDFSGCAIHVNIPPMASDSFCYEVARRVRDNLMAGRRVYLELADEWWNGAQSELYIGTLMSRLIYGGSADANTWYVVRTGQIRTIFRNVFGSRANEINALLNIAFTSPSYGGELFDLAVANNVTIDALAVAPYIDPNNSISQNITAWNGSTTLQQMIDLWIHDLYCCPGNFFNLTGKSTDANGVSHYGTIAAYNAAIAGNSNFSPLPGGCILHGYEGGFQTGAPSSANNHLGISRDMTYDPNWVVIEQDFYAILQRTGFTNFNIYSFSMYDVGETKWSVYSWPYQQPGAPSSNRNWFVTSGFTVDYPGTGSATGATNQDLNMQSVRGLAFLNWMSGMTSIPPVTLLAILCSF